MKARCFTLALLCTVASALKASDGLQSRLLEFDTLAVKPAEVTLANPALAGARQSVSMSSVSVGFRRSGLERPELFYLGKGIGAGSFDAATYMKTGRATITGEASYSRGKRFDVQYCEISDPALLYPYFTADELGGNLDSETYHFGGSYSSDFASGRWLYGVGLAYRAVQEYRTVDPRPKNTVGQLDIELGFGGRVGGYILGVGADLTRYRQSCSMMFVSELGEVPLYHLTGLGNHYLRFKGTGRNSLYSGWRRGISISVYPDKNGLFASASYRLFTFDKILRDLNNLPINHVHEYSIAAQAGFKSGRWSASANFDFRNRLGGEVIFGDASGNVYPELFTLATYRLRDLYAALQGCYKPVTSDAQRLDIYISAAYRHVEEIYAGTSPVQRRTVGQTELTLDAQYLRKLSSRLMLSATVSGELLTESVSRYGAQAGLDYCVDSGKSLGLSLSGNRLQAKDRNTGYDLTATLSFKF